MRRLLSFTSFALGCFICVCLLMATERRAMAMYVDPGSGLLAIQSAMAGLAAGAYFLRRKIRTLLGGKAKAEDELSVSAEAEKGDARKAA